MNAKDVYRPRALGHIIFLMTAAITVSTAAQDTNTPVASQASAQTAATFDELKQLLKDRYDGKIVVAALPGLYAGVQRMGDFGAGESGIDWSHFAANMQVPNRVPNLMCGSPSLGTRVSDLNQLDDHTFGRLTKGQNLSPIQTGEPLKVSKFYIYRDCVAFVLSTKGLEHWRDVDNSRTSVAGLGFEFVFYFNKGVIKDDHDYASVLREINKYLLPESEAQELANANKNIDIEPGMTEEQVIQKLGQPLQSVKFGDQKTLKYKGMTVVLKDGKVIDVKVE